MQDGSPILGTTSVVKAAVKIAADGSKPQQDDGSIKETLISLIISFVMALVFRSYVVEAFVIPTGSMAPTLLGAHMLFKSDQSGYEWPVNPWYHDRRGFEYPFPIQGPPTGDSPNGAPIVTDPMSTSRMNPTTPARRAPSGTGYMPVPPTRAGYSPFPEDKRARSGDRILVFKFLYELFPPKRYDVVVFKNPELSDQNFIKRLIGLPNEQIWIAGGDIFARPITKRAPGESDPAGDWKIQRKPHPVQEALWRPIYSSEYAPLSTERDGRSWFIAPWMSEQWKSDDHRVYRCDSSDESTLRWDTDNWPLWDFVPYNEFPLAAKRAFPVSDLRLRCAIKPDSAGLEAAATIRARGHEFQAFIHGSTAEVRMRTITGGEDGSAPTSVGEWSTLATGAMKHGLEAGRATNIEFWHFDQTLELYEDGKLIAHGEYDWGPSERLKFATGESADRYMEIRPIENPLSDPATYAPDRPTVWWTFKGAATTLYRVGLDRDIYYEVPNSPPALAALPARPATLGPDQFFCLGDNSPQSKDGRLWTDVDPWVADTIDREAGIVPRELMLGKAFFVYFPAPYRVGDLPIVPDIGRMRFIR
ncbi:MAG TPA: S26 family signal peptidase [Phycisphaerales bacterium]|nr:S26 family signal peptidase [Phycisphaerales bacterium]